MSPAYQATRDGKGSWAEIDGYRIVIKPSSNYGSDRASWWYGVYPIGEDGVTLTEGMAHSEEDAREWAEMSIQL